MRAAQKTLVKTLRLAECLALGSTLHIARVHVNAGTLEVSIDPETGDFEYMLVNKHGCYIRRTRDAMQRLLEVN